MAVAARCAQAAKQKARWCRRELGADAEVVCCASREKWRHSRGAGCVLIDDAAGRREAIAAADAVARQEAAARLEEADSDAETRRAARRASLEAEHAEELAGARRMLDAASAERDAL